LKATDHEACCSLLLLLLMLLLPAGGASDQINYVGATQSSNVRSENIALGSNENIDFDFGRRL
jgi:hypothetical protein